MNDEHTHSDEHIMTRTDAEFRQYVCDTLRELKSNQTILEAQTKKHIRLTEDIADLVEMGRSLFVFASKLGSILRWIGGVSAGSILLWQFFSDHLRNLLK